MQHKGFLWLASLPVLVILLASSQPRLYSPKSIPAQALLQEPASQEPASQEPASQEPASQEPASQEPTSTAKPTSAPVTQNTRAPRPTPTALRGLPVQQNPGLVIGAIIVVAIILFGVFRFTRK